MISLRVDTYTDTDFAVTYGHEMTNDQACTKSRTGFIITFTYFPVLYISTL